MYRMKYENSVLAKEPSDEWLCRQVALGNRDAEDALVLRYHRLVRACARPLFLTGGDSEDLLQEGMVGLLHAIREYDAEKAASFRTFAETCIRNRLYSVLRSAGCGKHLPLNKALPLDTALLGAEAGILQYNPEEQFISQDFVRHFLEEMRTQLSPLEAAILDAYLAGESCREIAQQLQKPYKSIDNAIQRVRRKIIRQLSHTEF